MTRALDLVFLWHMHQPDYRDGESGEFVLPWVYLHALKDYSDMAAHLERHPRMRAVVNFVPVLLDQIEDYCAQFDAGSFRDPLLRLLGAENLDAMARGDRDLVLATCFRTNHVTMLAPYAHYQRLADMHALLTRGDNGNIDYLSGQYFADLLTWYHLSWCGETVRRDHALPAQLMSKGSGFTGGERRALRDLIGKVLRGLVPRYRALAEAGRIEISTTPGTHPLAPLLIDFHSARESQPDAPLPQCAAYPGGRSRVEAHIAAATRTHERRFGSAPQGFWPAEGALSEAFVQQLDAEGCRWAAAGEGLLRHSLAGSEAESARAAYRPWRLESAPRLTLFFRDERLSDLIGFEYATWHGRDAASHFIAQVEAILAASDEDERPVLSVILDGENAWEHYPYNGYYFFEDLYSLLDAHASIRTTTYAELLARETPPPISTLPRLVAGSWVYGTMSTWIGSRDKNHAWDLLCAAKQAYDLVMASGRLSADESTATEKQLAVCESSDWFWWFGDYNPAAAVATFDALFRHNLRRLYELLRLPPPALLDIPISHGSEHAAEGGGTMRRGTEHTLHSPS